mmetsp:Transcript_15339/g.18486  ORF Transcript_15339/g.18486 Transcript_15339/m.18486 type:complete len:508 (+) Transcript_15339:144-1667(+)|eukprot:CAMPEP_0197843724 /NCGR_PEP_ID=MMETSP1438-20131217/658_1 /TAXON_ID=1461541 /ORGANISM="Pterosperma sp., Strain CCMP1384" /LENGTH=507 /DNA_ID=CAMNT_0043454075 /DNA_START=140 /DNA_END=1663 /DNA_ORIENTATION=-
MLRILVTALLVGAASAFQEKVQHCENGLCLTLTPGSETGFHPPVNTLDNQLASETVLRDGSDFLRIYFPRLPRSGTVHFRKLWEETTKTTVEAVSIKGGLQYDERTAGYTVPCGGLSLSATNHNQTAQQTPRCRHVHVGEGYEPVVFLSDEPFEWVGAFYKDKSDVILQIVRNPVDAYNSMFVSKNPKFRQSRNAADLNWKVSFPDYLSTIYLPYLMTFAAKSTPDQAKVILRYEDMYMNPTAFMKEALVFTGAARALGMNAKGIRESVQYVQQNTKKVPKPGAAMGEGFKIVHGRNLELAMFHLQQHKEILEGLGYNYYLEAEGPPETMDQIENFHKERHAMYEQIIHGKESVLGRDQATEPMSMEGILATGLFVALCVFLIGDELHSQKTGVYPVRGQIIVWFAVKSGPARDHIRDMIADMDFSWIDKNPLTSFVGRKTLYASVFNRASASADQAFSTGKSDDDKVKEKMTVGEIKQALSASRKSESPADRLARLKALRSSLAGK